MMQASNSGRQIIAAFEKNRLKSYRDAGGVWTIGYGHTTSAGGSFTLIDGTRVTKVGPGQEITLAESDRLFDADIDVFEKIVTAALGPAIRTIEQQEFDAFVSLAFNIGGPQFRRSTALARYKRGDKAGAAAAILWWDKVKGQQLRGLTRRRQAEKALFEGNFAEARRYAQAQIDQPSRNCDVPKPPKSIAKSKTAGAATVGGVAGAGAALEMAHQTAEQAAQGVAAASGVIGLLGDVARSPVFWVAVAAVILACVAFIIWDRWRKLKVDAV